MFRSLIIFCNLFIWSFSLYSQSFVYSKDYFRWPLGNKPEIVANFGELRAGHWHMGLDIRTNQKINMPVYAAADGYISRISVRSLGYGQAVYINHPNGLTTVYGHLNKFFSKLDSMVASEQYKQQSWEIELRCARNQFPVKKGQFIAYSGNTGSSEGPHLHFEIRDTRTERCINPLFFSLPIPDATPPVFTKLAMYDRCLSVYDQNPLVFHVRKIKNGYAPAKDVLIKTGFSKLGFAVGAYDRVSGSANPNGIYSARIFLDGLPLDEFVLDSMDYSETGYVNAHIDYGYRYKGGAYLQKLFKLPGDQGRAYRKKNNDGTIVLNDSIIHQVRIEISDIKKNRSVLSFKLQYSDSLHALLKYAAHHSFTPNYVNVFEQNDFEAYLPENCLYDSVQPAFYRINQPLPNAVSSLFQFCDAAVPIHGKMSIRIKPNAGVPESLKDKIVIKRTDAKNKSYQRAKWEKDWVAAEFGDFGAYQAFIDSEPPRVNELGTTDTIDLSSSKSIAFYPHDNTAIRSFRAELDGQWLMFTNDKGAAWIYNFGKRSLFGVHQLKVKVEDIAGNVTEKKWLFKRYPYAGTTKKILHKKGSGKKRLIRMNNKKGKRK
jgi:murein DD-endopeptidase MepM/ murein hydrolase activator NlpD